MARVRDGARWRRSLVAGAAALALVACTSNDPEPDAEPVPPEEVAAAGIAAALTSGDFADAPVDDRDRATTETEEVLGALAGIPREVSVSWVSSVYDEGDGQAADAALSWTWDIEGTDDDWTYPVSVHLTGSEDGPWRADWSRDLLGNDLGDAGVFAVSRTTPERGDVLGDGDEVLVTNRGVYRIGIDKTHVDAASWESSALALATELGFSDPQSYADRVLSAGSRAFLEAVVVAQEDPGDVDLDAVRAIPGVNLVADERQLGPTDSFARPLLGRVGEATAEIIAESDGEIVEGDMVGRSGLQQQYDEAMRGIRGTTITLEGGEEPVEVYRAEPVRGADLRTTLDADLQVLAERILAPLEPASALVAIRASTGEVLAAASGPGSEGWSTATLGQYAPGSTFKVVTTLALLRAGLTLDDPVPCTPTLTVDGREFSNYPGYPAAGLGDVPLATAIAHSCNTALMAQADRVDAAAVAEAAAALGLTGSTDLGYAAFLGSVPAEAGGTLHAADLIGQGQVLASPLGMATVAASIAAGHAVSPVLVHGPEADASASGSDGAEGTEDADGTDGEETTDGAEQPAVPLTNVEAALVRQAMRGVVTTGTATLLADVPGEDVAAKSGTAEHGDGLTSAWMIAIQGDLAVAAFVEVGEYGSATSGPLVREFLVGAQG